MLWYTYLYENRTFTNKQNAALLEKENAALIGKENAALLGKENAWEVGWVKEKRVALIKSLIDPWKRKCFEACLSKINLK